MRTIGVKGAVSSCAVDAVSGDLAVFFYPSAGGEALLIYPKAKGHPKQYLFPHSFQLVSCTYDDNGNVFVNRVDPKVSKETKSLLSELPKGRSNFVDITLPNTITQVFNAPGVIRWDGKNLALGNGEGSIYRMTVFGTKAKIVGVTRLDGSFDVASFWIHDSTLAGANTQSSSVMIWNYPKGGEPSKVINNVESGDIVTISVAQSLLSS